MNNRLYVPGILDNNHLSPTICQYTIHKTCASNQAVMAIPKKKVNNYINKINIIKTTWF